MPLFISYIDPELKIQGSTQQFLFDAIYPLATMQLLNQFIPISTIDSNIQLDLINSSLNGYRTGLNTSLSNGSGMWHLSQLLWNNDGEKSNYSVNPLLTFNKNENGAFNFQGYSVGGVKDPVLLQDVVTLNYFNTHGGGGGGSGTVRSVGMNTTTDGLTITGSPVTTSGNIAINLNTELQGLSTLSTMGFLARTATGTYIPRTIITDSSGNILIQDGVGTNNPIIKLSLTPNLNSVNLINGIRAFTLSAPSTLPSNLNFMFPNSNGSSGQILSTDGNGHTSWINGGVGNVTSVGIINTDTNLMVTGSPITSAGNIRIGLADSIEVKSVTAQSLSATALISLSNNKGGYCVMAIDQTTSANFNFYLPGSNGILGQILSTDGNGHTSWINNGTTGGVTSIVAGNGLTGGTITSSGTIGLANTTVTPGTYNGANIIVNAQGQITNATSGSTTAGVYGPTSSVVNTIALWNNITGSVLKDDQNIYINTTDAAATNIFTVNYYTRLMGNGSQNPGGSNGYSYNASGPQKYDNIPNPYPFTGLYVKNAIIAPLYVSASSKNIKNILDDGIKIENEALELFKKISLKKYEYKDKIKNGSRIIYGMIAEELEEIIPGAIVHHEDFLPNIMQHAEIIELFNTPNSFIYKLSFKNEFHDQLIKIGDKIELKDGEESKYGTIIELGQDFIKVELHHSLKENIFIYGTYGNCPTVDKIQIFELALVVLQNLMIRIETLEKK